MKNGRDCGHGWVYPNPNGSKARCGGPAICSACARDQAQLHELVEKAPERQEASVQKWLSNPEFKASLYQFSQSKIHNLRLAIEAAEAVLRVLRRTLAEEEGR